MMSPNEISYKSNSKAGKSNGFIPENRPTCKSWDNFRDNPHCRQNHYINGRMRIYPKQMLKKYWVASHCRVEYTNMEKSFYNNQNDCDSDNRSCNNLNPRCCIQSPNKQRHSKKCHSGRPQSMDSSYKIQSSKYRGEPQNESPQQWKNNIGGSSNTIWNIESPASINRSTLQKQCNYCKYPSENIEPPRQ